MRILTAVVFGAALIGLAAAGPAEAQFPTIPRDSMDPAYRHFLMSPYSYRAFSAFGRGYSETAVSPFGYQSTYVEPWYLHQRITPEGFESHRYVPGYGGSSADPWGYGGYQVPGYTQNYFAPRAVLPMPAPRPATSTLHSSPPPVNIPR